MARIGMSTRGLTVLLGAAVGAVALASASGAAAQSGETTWADIRRHDRASMADTRMSLNDNGHISINPEWINYPVRCEQEGCVGHPPVRYEYSSPCMTLRVAEGERRTLDIGGLGIQPRILVYSGDECRSADRLEVAARRLGQTEQYTTFTLIETPGVYRVRVVADAPFERAFRLYSRLLP